MKKTILGVGIVLALGVGFWFWQNRGIDLLVPSSVQVGGSVISFSNQKKSAHFETSTPSHGDRIAAVPLSVVIDFNFDLGPGSKISVMHDGKEYGVGESVIDSNLLALRKRIDPSAPDGLYAVDYTACWPDGSCHKGHFEFVVDRSLSSSYVDMTGKKDVEILLKGNVFVAKDIRISKGTKVTWVNNDSVVHYVNSDSHPAHTYYPMQNSKALKQNDTYSVIFEMPGSYPYHCSAHANTMVANIIVE